MGGYGLNVNDVMAAAPGPSPSTSAPAPDEPPGVQMRMFKKIIWSGLTIKSQQRGEPDLNEEESMAALGKILQERPGAFLMRFGSILDTTDLEFFSNSSEYEVQFRVRELQKLLVPEQRETRTRNRRYECMKELMDTDYFSENEMRQRNPLLFEHYEGQYLSEEERAALDSTSSDMALSSHIMRKMQHDERRERERRQREKEEEQEEEEDTSSEEEEEEEMEGEERVGATETDKRRQRQEFLRAMQLSFLRGDDEGFDYGSVDTDERFDSIATLQQDGEDAYFDEEEPEWCDTERDTLPRTSGEETRSSPQR